jgi:hypothetical protein
VVASLGQHCGQASAADRFGQGLHDVHDGCRVLLRRLAPTISMMEAAQTRARYPCRLGRRLLLHRSPIRRVLLEGIVNAVFVVVAHVVPHQPAKMRLVPRDDMVENLPPTASYPALRRVCLSITRSKPNGG